MSLGSNIIIEWERRNAKLDHDYAITGWALSVIPEVRADVEELLIGDHRNTINRVVLKLHEPLYNGTNDFLK